MSKKKISRSVHNFIGAGNTKRNMNCNKLTNSNVHKSINIKKKHVLTRGIKIETRRLHKVTPPLHFL